LILGEKFKYANNSSFERAPRTDNERLRGVQSKNGQDRALSSKEK